MDIVELLNDLTGGQLLLWKVLLTSVIFACAGLQVLLAARFYEASTVPPISTGGGLADPSPERQAHRHPGRGRRPLLPGRAGRAHLPDPGAAPLGLREPGLRPARGQVRRAQAAAGPGARYLPWIGSGLFLTFAAIWATTVADYVSAR